MSRVRAFNERLAEAVTKGVGTMWCAYAFAALACISLPQAIAGGASTLIAWIAQTFLQLVLLSVLMVGQQRSSDWIAATLRETHDAVVSKVDVVTERVDDLHEKHDAVQVKVDELHGLHLEGKLPERHQDRS